MLSQYRDARLRVSEGLDELDQANAVFNFVLFSLQHFVGTGDPAWDHRLAASVNVARLLDQLSETESDTILAASREVALHRLPRLLSIAMVSVVETCLKDLSEILIRLDAPPIMDDELATRVAKLHRGGPADYLPRLVTEFGLSSLAVKKWEDFQELAATRNILVHSSQPIADERYVRNAGPAGRAAVGGSLEVDNAYFVSRYIAAKGGFYSLLQELNARDTAIPE
jgi:hypothetical protein